MLHTPRELFNQTRQSQHFTTHGTTESFLALPEAPIRCAQKRARRNKPKPCAPSYDERRVENGSRTLPDLPNQIHSPGLLHSAKSRRRRRRRPECDDLRDASSTKIRRPLRVHHLVHAHRLQRRANAPPQTQILAHRILSRRDRKRRRSVTR